MQSRLNAARRKFIASWLANALNGDLIDAALVIVWQRDKHARDTQLNNLRYFIKQTIGGKYNENDRSDIELQIQVFQKDWQPKP